MSMKLGSPRNEASVAQAVEATRFAYAGRTDQPDFNSNVVERHLLDTGYFGVSVQQIKDPEEIDKHLDVVNSPDAEHLVTNSNLGAISTNAETGLVTIDSSPEAVAAQSGALVLIVAHGIDPVAWSDRSASQV